MTTEKLSGDTDDTTNVLADDDDAPEGESAATESTGENQDGGRFYKVITMPEDMFAALEKVCVENKLPATTFVRRLIAREIGFELPDDWKNKSRASKYATDEERKAALKTQATIRADRDKLAKAMIKAQFGKGITSPEYAAALKALEEHAEKYPIK